MMYGENYYPSAKTLREARIALHLLGGDAARVVDVVAMQDAQAPSILARVYARGVRAWSLGHPKDTTAELWGLARVLEYVDGGAATRTVDRDLVEPAQVLAPMHVEITVAPDAVGVMLPIPLAVAQKYVLDVPGAESADEFHMTLVYLGKLSLETLAAVRAAVKEIATQHAPFEGKISGIGRFNAPEKDPLYLSVDAVHLTAFREAVFRALPPTEQRHGFTPHVTLAYMPKDEPTPTVEIHDDVLNFDRVEVWVGGKREVFLLTGKPVQPALEYRNDTELKTAEDAKTAMQQWLANKSIEHVAVGVGIGSDTRYRVELRVFSDDVDTDVFPTKMQGVRVNVVRMPIPVPLPVMPDGGASTGDVGFRPDAGLEGQRMQLTDLVIEGLAVVGLTELSEAKKKAKKKRHPVLSGTVDKHNAKRKKLVKLLSKNPNVRDPEALATFIGLRIAGIRSHGK